MKPKLWATMIMLAVLLTTLLNLTSCSFFSAQNNSNETVIFSSYLDIPGVTAQEIAAISNIRRNYEQLVFGTLESTETFTDDDGVMRGFTTLLCDWLSEVFGIPFVPQHFTWNDLFEGLDDGSIQFTSEFAPTPARLEEYHMTQPIARRSLQMFRLESAPPFEEIGQTRPVRYIQRDGTTLVIDVFENAEYETQVVYAADNEDARYMLLSGEGDVFVTSSSQRFYFDTVDSLVIEDFSPMLHLPASLAACKDTEISLEVIIDVVQKALDAGGIHHINAMYERGNTEFMRHNLRTRFTSEERAFVRERPVVKVVAEHSNYPFSFYDSRTGKWQGIAFDIMGEITKYTGVRFEIVNDSYENRMMPLNEMLSLLESGEAHMITRLIETPARQGQFLWQDESILTERPALISKTDHRRISRSQVYYERVGVVGNSAFHEFFEIWFPEHELTFVFANQQEAFAALMNDEIDMVMASHNSLLYLTSYHEMPEFKANIVFDDFMKTTFGVNLQQETLNSVINKTLGVIETDEIADQWLFRSYDYRVQLLEARIPWMIFAGVLMMLTIALGIVMLVRRIRSGKYLERLVAQRTAELSYERTTLNTLFDTIPDLIYTKDTDLCYTHRNSAYIEHQGSNNRCNDKYDEINLQVIKENAALSTEELITGKDGVANFYETIRVPLTATSGEVIGVMGVSRNITRRKEVEAMLTKESQSKSSFLANMSHEIRTPLNTIVGVTNILLTKENVCAEVGNELNKIHVACDLLLGIINDILDLSKIEVGRLDIAPDKYNTASLIYDTAQINAISFEKKKDIKFELSIDPYTPAFMIGDELRIKQILNNLLSNAFKYTDAGTVTLTIKAQYIKGGKSATLIMCVKDTGHGMSKNQLGKIFDEYSRFNRGPRDAIEGTGLGLAVVQRLVHLMGGKIEVESEPGVGTQFTVSLKQGVESCEFLGEETAQDLMSFKAGVVSQKERDSIVHTAMEHGRVLIVDDVETNLHVASGLLALYSLNIETAKSGFEAIDKIKEGKVYDIIFMDHMMPQMDGVEAMQAIRELGYDKAIVVLTANATSRHENLFLQSKFDDFISKPIDLRRLDMVLNKHIPQLPPKTAPKLSDAPETPAIPAVANVPEELLIESFAQDAKTSIASIKEYLNGECDIKEYIVSVHGIKSALANIGKAQLSAQAKALEMAGREGNTDFINSDTPALLTNLEELLGEFETRLAKAKEESVGAKIDITSKEFADLVGAIKLSCDDYDRKRALNLMAQLREYSLSDLEIADIDDILENINNLVINTDFDEAAQLAEKLAKKIFKEND